MRRWEDVKKMWRWEDVKKMWRRCEEDVKMRRCEENVKMRRCEEDVKKMWRCQDGKKMWWQTSTIRRTLRSDALRKNSAWQARTSQKFSMHLNVDTDLPILVIVGLKCLLRALWNAGTIRNAHRIICMRDGKVVECGTPKDSADAFRFEVLRDVLGRLGTTFAKIGPGSPTLYCDLVCHDWSKWPI